MSNKRKKARTSARAFGSGSRESHDSSSFYDRFKAPLITDDETVNRDQNFLDGLGEGGCFVGDSRNLEMLADNSVALVVTSPPYFVGKEYEIDLSEDSTIPSNYVEHLDLLKEVFAECYRVLEPGGRICVNIANLGRKPYRSQSSDVIQILQDQIGFLLRGELVWEKSKTSSGSCAWGSFAKASNPVIRDMTERVIIASKGRFERAITPKQRQKQDLPFESTLSNDEFMDSTTDVWNIAPESAKRVGHPAPFPVALPERLINLFTYVDDVVLDPFCGVGSTLVAAAKSGRIGIGIDTDPDYVEAANQRLSEFSETNQLFSTKQVAQYSKAVQAGKKLADLAEAHLESMGSTWETSARSCTVGGNQFDYYVTDKQGSEFYCEVSGGFLIDRAGIASTEQALQLLGKAALARSQSTQPLLVLTAKLPTPGSKAAKVIEAGELQGLLRVEQIAFS